MPGLFFSVPPDFRAGTGYPDGMTLDVLLFASYADAFGATSLRVELPEGATVEALLGSVRALRPEAPLPRALIAVNQEYATPGQQLREGDEVALIPPVAGG